MRRRIRGLDPVDSAPVIDPVDSILAALSIEQRAALMARLVGVDNALGRADTVPNSSPTENGSGDKSPEPQPSASFSTIYKERATGLEPATSSLGSWHSTN